MKRILVVILSMILVFSISAIACADNERVSGAFSYIIKGNGTAAITGYDWSNEDIYIPRMIDGYTVTEIAEEAFASLTYDENGIVENRSSIQVRSITIPDTIRFIGDKAFMNTSFDSFNILIPSSVEYIGAGAFTVKGNVDQFIVDSSNPIYTTIDGVLYNKPNKELIAFPPAKTLSGERINDNEVYTIAIPEGIAVIGDYAFFGLGSIDGGYVHYSLPSTLKRIGNYAFARNSGFGIYNKDVKYLDISITLPEAVSELGEGAFYYASSQDLYYYIDLRNTMVKEIPEYAFFGCEVYAREGIRFPKNLEYIRKHAFEKVALQCIGTIRFPASLKSIDDFAFANLMKIKENRILFEEGSQLTTIGAHAFEDSGLLEMVLPDSLKTIGDSAFSSCGFSKVFLPSGLESIGNFAFSRCDNLRNLSLPGSVKHIGDSICDRTITSVDAPSGSYASIWASENGFVKQNSGKEDTSWLTNP